MSFSQTIDPNNWPGMTGYWTFDDSQHIEHATVGNDLELFGSQQHVTGYDSSDGATRIGINGYYKCTHNIAPNGGGYGSRVNEYSLLIDFKIPSLGQYYCFYQTDPNNANDGEIFVNPSGHVGISATYYTPCVLQPGEWYRLIISVDLGSTFRYYIDGQLVLDGHSQNLDGRFSLGPFFYWFRDDNGEDHEFDVSTAAIFDHALTGAEAASLGGFGHSFPEIPVAGIDPYLQSPTPTSIYVSWHSTDTTNTIVNYGTTPVLGQQASGTYENISGKIWHTVKLEGLTPDTEYYYEVISGVDTSEVSSFRTINTLTATGRHVRFLILGDSRTDVYRTSEISQAAEQQLINLYGADWQNQVDLVMHVGDIAETDVITRYVNEYFTPYANLSKKIPFMVSVGNHEYIGQADNFFKYMKYEDLTGSPYEYPSPYNEKFYKFRIGDVLFISLNSNYAMAVQEQIDWLQTVLDSAETDPTIDFVFAYCHHPGHSEIWPDGNTDYVQNHILPVLKNYSKVSMLSYGHSHAYERGVFQLDTLNPNYQHDMHLLLTGGAGSALDRWGMYSNQQDYPEIHMTYDYYVYSIVDVDCDNKSWTVKTYSLGNPDKVLNNELIDEWYCKLNQSKPGTPVAIGIENQGTPDVELLASAYSGVDSLMTSQFQLTATPGDYTNPVLDVTRDWHNIYGDSGSPDYTPVDLNAGIVLNRLNVNGYVDSTHVYGWRVRYRDFNLKWSDWSNEYIINDSLTAVEKVHVSKIRISPNPATNMVNISYYLSTGGNVTIKLFNSLGMEIRTFYENDLQHPGEHHYTLYFPEQTKPGIYYLDIGFSGKHITKKLILNR